MQEDDFVMDEPKGCIACVLFGSACEKAPSDKDFKAGKRHKDCPLIEQDVHVTFVERMVIDLHDQFKKYQVKCYKLDKENDFLYSENNMLKAENLDIKDELASLREAVSTLTLENNNLRKFKALKKKTG